MQMYIPFGDCKFFCNVDPIEYVVDTVFLGDYWVNPDDYLANHVVLALDASVREYFTEGEQP